jgi:YjjG family noncanonical pyrimidine nucleotidase
MVLAVLLDLDDTVFDHRHSSRSALKAVHSRHACLAGVPFDDFEQAHSRILEEFHREVLFGRIALDDARVERFRRLFGVAGVEADAALAGAAAAMYRREYQASWRAIKGAAALLAALRRRARVGIVSNNLMDEQQDKLRYCELAPHVDAVVVSEHVGAIKPDPAIFHVALERLGATASEAVMVGDSWSADVVGARRAGIRAIWFNPEGRPRPEPAPEVAELRALEPLDPVLDVIFGEVETRADRR